MKKTAFAAIMIAAELLWMPLSAGGARAQLLRNPNITIDYVEPMNPSNLNQTADDPALTKKNKQAIEMYPLLVAARDRLMKDKFLERYSQFLVALRLPTTLRLRTKACGEANAFFSPEDSSINLCYEYVLKFERIMPKQTTSDGFTPEATFTGLLVSTILHETGHALFSLYTVPILGKEEDAADEIAGFIAMQFGNDVAATIIKGAAWKWSSDDWSSQVYYDVHSDSRTRFLNFVCMGYGGNPTLFKQFIRFLPADRAPNCANEYQMAKLAFDKTILPHIDPQLMQRVQSTKWLLPSEMDK